MAATQDALPPVLEAMLASRTTLDPAGGPVALHSGVDERYARTLHRLVLERRPRVVVEVGLAYGVSALAILGALEAAGGDGRLISVDPYQERDFGGLGLHAIARAGLAHRHELRALESRHALSDLERDGVRAQLGYVDGWHTFDVTLADVLGVDRLLDVGGAIGVNDSQMPAVHRAIAAFLAHRDYEELDVGLEPRWPGGRIDRLRARREGRREGDRWFAKRSAAEPSWDFHAPF